MHTQALSLLAIVFASIAADGAPLHRTNEPIAVARRAFKIPKPAPAAPKAPVVPPKLPPPSPPKATPPSLPKTTAASPPKTTDVPPSKTSSVASSKSSSSSSSTASSSTASSSQSAAPACPVKPKAAPAKSPAKTIAGRAKTKTPSLLCGVQLRTAAAGSCKGKKRFTFSGGQLNILNSRADTDSESNSGKSDSDNSTKDPTFIPNSDDELEDDHEFDDDFLDEESDGSEQCDHVLELQVLKKTLAANGACTALDAIIKAGQLTDADRQTVVNPLVDAVNDKKNLFFLDATLNQVKANEVNRGLGAAGGQLFDKTDLDKLAQFKAVDQYLTAQTTASKKLASDLDTAATKMIDDAAKLANANIPCAGLTKAQADKALGQVKTAQTGFKATSSVATAWAKVLKFVDDQAS